MRVPKNLDLPSPSEGVTYLQQLVKKLTDAWAGMAVQVNSVSEGQIFGYYNAQSGPPTSGDHAQGDFVPNNAPVELGSAGSKYFIDGWKCVASGTPGTWVQKRCLTGN